MKEPLKRFLVNVHQHEVYHLLLDKSAESVLKQRFPELDYKVLDGGISVETRNPDPLSAIAGRNRSLAVHPRTCLFGRFAV